MRGLTGSAKRPLMRFDKTVLQIIPALNSGGAERTTVEIAEAIVAAGGRALVATSGGRLCAEIERMGGRILALPVHSKNPLTILANRGRLIRIIRSERVDLVHARSRAPAWSALFAARATQVPMAATYHGAYSAPSRIKKFLNSSMVRADLVIANSLFTAEAIRRTYAVGDRLRVIPRGADLRQFNPRAIAAARIAAIRRSWGLGEMPVGPVLLLPGRLTEWKGHRVAIEAVDCIRRAGAGGDLRLIFAGDSQGVGDFAEALRRRVEELGLQRMIRFVGHCDDMAAAYAACDVVLSPSTRPEAFGRIAAEGGAMEKVVIAADHGGARETVIDGETGFLVAAGSASGLSQAIHHAISLGADGRRSMGARARARIEQNFSTKAMTEATLAAYAELLGRQSAAS